MEIRTLLEFLKKTIRSRERFGFFSFNVNFLIVLLGKIIGKNIQKENCEKMAKY